MPQPFSVRDQANPGRDLGSWDANGNITIPGTITAGNVVGGNPGTVTSVTPGDSTITVGGTAAAPTVAVNTIAESKVTNLVSDLAGKAASVHTHAESDVTNLVSDLALKAPLASPTLTGSIVVPNIQITGTQTISTAAIGVTQTVFVANDVTVNNTTTLADVTGLAWPVVAGTYVFDGFFMTSTNTTANAKFGWSTTGGGSVSWSLFSVTTSAASQVGSLDAGAGVFVLSNSGSGATFVGARPAGVYVASGSGTVKLQFAQNTANVSNTIVKAGSFIRYTRVA